MVNYLNINLFIIYSQINIMQTFHIFSIYIYKICIGLKIYHQFIKDLQITWIVFSNCGIIWTISLIDSIGIKLLYKSVIFTYGQSNLKCLDWFFMLYHQIKANFMIIIFKKIYYLKILVQVKEPKIQQLKININNEVDNTNDPIMIQ